MKTFMVEASTVSVSSVSSYSSMYGDAITEGPGALSEEVFPLFSYTAQDGMPLSIPS